jgi:hypothetical protein
MPRVTLLQGIIGGAIIGAAGGFVIALLGKLG